LTLIQHGTREIHFKIVYYGPGLGGKTANLEYIYARLDPRIRGGLVSLATELDRTLYFDFLPVDLGEIQGFATRFHLYTVPGQVYYNASRKLILQGVDGVVFVADSLESRMEANLESLDNLMENLMRVDQDLSSVPLVVQYNKRDLDGALPLEHLRAELNPEGRAPEFEAVANRGVGVFETLQAVGKRVVRTLG